MNDATKIIRRLVYLLVAGSAGRERSTVSIDTVKRGPMVREVQGIGTLVPGDIEWIQEARR